jgi:hypothetical protein
VSSQIQLGALGGGVHSGTQRALARLASSREPMTAKELGVTAKALRRAGAEVAGERRSGGRGRPALLFRVGS